MESNTQTFLDELILQDERIRTTYHLVFEEWSPTAPPLTILFGELGHRIAQIFKEDPTTLVETFELIETAMNSPSEELVTSVATGLIEAMVTECSPSGGIERLLKALGALSKRHALGWIAE